MKNISKITVSVVTAFVVGIFSFGAIAVPHVQAQTKAELQAQIQDLLEQIAQLRAQIEGESGGSAPRGCQMDFTRNLSVGSTGTQVQQLQRFLNAIPSVQVARTGPGSPGQETRYFGPLTKAAVNEFQRSYSPQVLAPLGLSSPTGFWGPSSRSQANSICAQRQAQVDIEDEEEQEEADEQEENESDQDDELSGNEGAIDDYELTTPTDEELAQGETRRVLGFEFEADGSDLRVERVDFLFEGVTQTNNEDPWDYIESMSLYRGDTKLVTRSDIDESAFSEEGDDSNRGAPGFEEYRFRFSGIDSVVEEGGEVEFFLEISTNDIIDSADLPQDFLISVADGSNSNDGIRAVDAVGVQQYGGDAAETGTISFEEPDTGNLVISTHPDDLEERVVHVDDNSDTEDVSALRFEMEARDQDIAIEDITMRASSTGNDLRDIAEEFTLKHDGDVIESESINGTGMSDTILFEDIDLELEEENVGDFEIAVDIHGTDNQTQFQDGDTLEVAVDADDIEAEEITGDGDNLNASTLDGKAESEPMHFYETAPQFAMRDTSLNVGSVDNQGDVHQATYRITFEVSADDQEDIFIPFYDRNNSESIVASTTNGVGTVLSPEPSITATISEDPRSSAGVERETNTWRVPAGNTGVFTLTLNANNEGAPSTRFVAAKVESLKWNTADSLSGLTEFAFNLEDWETEPVVLDK